MSDSKDVEGEEYRKLKEEVDRLLAAGYSRWRIEDCLVSASPNPDFERNMTKEAGWRLKRDVEPVLKARDDIARITIVDIFSAKYSPMLRHLCPNKPRCSYRNGEVLAFPEQEFGCKPMGQRDAEFILAVQKAREVDGHKWGAGYVGIPENQIKQQGIDGYFGELAFPGTIWIDIAGVYYLPVLFYGDCGFFMAFVPVAVHWASAPHRQVGLPTLSR